MKGYVQPKMSRGTDDPFYQLMRIEGEAILKFVGVGSPEKYEAKAIVLKEKKLYPDIIAVPKTAEAKDRIFIEFQGYKDAMIRYSMAAKIAMSCAQDKYAGPVLGAIVYTDKSFRDAALPLDIGSPNGPFYLKARFREIVLSDYTTEQLLSIDPRLIILAPFTIPKNTRKDRLTEICREWSGKISETYRKDRQKDIIQILGLFILNRFRNLSVEEVIVMLHLDLAKTKAGKQLIGMGVEKGFEKGVKQGVRQGVEKGVRQGVRQGMKKMIIDAVVERWNTVPNDIAAAIKKISSIETLDILFKNIFRSQTMEDFRVMLNQVKNES